jgi:hypothetical protein
MSPFCARPPLSPRFARDAHVQPHDTRPAGGLAWEDGERPIRDVKVLVVMPHTIQRVGHAVQVAFDVKREVVEHERDVHMAASGRSIRIDGHDHDVSTVRDGDVDLIMKDLQAIRPRKARRRRWRVLRAVGRGRIAQRAYGTRVASHAQSAPGGRFPRLALPDPCVRMRLTGDRSHGVVLVVGMLVGLAHGLLWLSSVFVGLTVFFLALWVFAAVQDFAMDRVKDYVAQQME